MVDVVRAVGLEGVVFAAFFGFAARFVGAIVGLSVRGAPVCALRGNLSAPSCGSRQAQAGAIS